MAPDTAQRDAALLKANARRLLVADFRRDVREGRMTLAEVMADPLPELENWPVIDVVRMQWRKPRGGEAVERLGRMAVRDGINLMVPLGRASTRTREWIAEHATWQCRAQQDAMRVYVGVLE